MFLDNDIYCSVLANKIKDMVKKERERDTVCMSSIMSLDVNL